MISAAIVTYNENINDLKKTVDSFLETPLKKKLYLINNYPKQDYSKEFTSKEIKIINNPNNLGFGKAHNLILADLNSQFHLILNPDVEFNKNVISELLLSFKNSNTDLGFVSPKVFYPDGTIQKICRKHPTFLSLINRKIKFSKKLFYKENYLKQSLDKVFYPEFIHGCFMLFKTDVLKKVNGFDERYFLYMEDADICRELEKRNFKILYNPKASITHQHKRGSSKNLKLFYYHFVSAFKYFLKWGF